jgi:hypothetical protein
MHNVTDREMIAGLYNAIIALAEKLTGETLTVYVSTEAGEIPIGAGRVRWSTPSTGFREPQARCGRE